MMAAEQELYSSKVSIILNNGTTTTGNIKTKSISLPHVVTTYTTATNGQQLLNVVDALADIFDVTMHDLRWSPVYSISASA